MKKQMIQRGLVFSMIMLLMGCGKGPSESTPAVSSHPTLEKKTMPSEAVVEPSAGVGSVSGRVQFSGVAPIPTAIAMNADPYCASANPAGAKSESLLVGSDGALQNAFVYIEGEVHGASFSKPTDAVVLDQNGCRYTPHVLGIQVSQPITIINSDTTLHNVHALPTKSKPFNLGMPIQGMKLSKSFNTSEIMVKVKCDVHPWMSAYVGVMPHPFF